MFGHSASSSYPRTGTTSPIFVSREPSAVPQFVTVGQDYFLVQVYAAQVAFRGNIWDKVKRLVVTSQVNLNHRNLDNRGMRAIQRTRDVQKNHSQPLGLNPNLVGLVPAVMPNISLSIDFILDKENRLAQLGSLINSDSFLNVVSLAPGASAVAKTVAQLADKVIQTFIPAEENKALLSFGGDFNLATRQLQEGYYVIIGSKDDQNPLPDSTAKLAVQDRGLLVNGQPATQWSYIVLDVQRTDLRPRELNDGASWDIKLREAEDEAQRVTLNPRATNEEKTQAWNRCSKLIEEAQTLLRADDNFLPKDATNITTAAIHNCQKLVVQDQSTARGLESSKGGEKAPAFSWSPDLPNTLKALGLDPGMDLEAAMNEYADQLIATRRKLRALGVS